MPSTYLNPRSALLLIFSDLLCFFLSLSCFPEKVLADQDPTLFFRTKSSQLFRQHSTTMDGQTPSSVPPVSKQAEASLKVSSYPRGF